MASTAMPVRAARSHGSHTSCVMKPLAEKSTRYGLVGGLATPAIMKVPSAPVATGARSNVGATCAPAIEAPLSVSVSRPAADHVAEGAVGVTGVEGGAGAVGVDEPPQDARSR